MRVMDCSRYVCITKDKCKVWYLKNHSLVGQDLTLGEGLGLRMLMSSTPCKQNPRSCHGAKMAADHITSISSHKFGDYELRMRAPYALNGSGGTCDSGIYAYFTAGYVNKNGKWNEMNFVRTWPSCRSRLALYACCRTSLISLLRRPTVEVTRLISDLMFVIARAFTPIVTTTELKSAVSTMTTREDITRPLSSSGSTIGMRVNLLSTILVSSVCPLLNQRPLRLSRSKS